MLKAFAGDEPSLAVDDPDDDRDRARARRVVEYIRHRIPPERDRESDAREWTPERDETIVLRVR